VPPLRQIRAPNRVSAATAIRYGGGVLSIAVRYGRPAYHLSMAGNPCDWRSDEWLAAHEEVERDRRQGHWMALWLPLLVLVGLVVVVVLA
jgi:hypothetical protein